MWMHGNIENSLCSSFRWKDICRDLSRAVNKLKNGDDDNDDDGDDDEDDDDGDDSSDYGDRHHFDNSDGKNADMMVTMVM